MSDLVKAWKNGKRGKFRRVDGGKLKFIRSEDGVVEKDADPGFVTDTPTCLCKVTDPCGCGKRPKGEMQVEKAEEPSPATCDCSHPGVCKDDVDCPCDCTEHETCVHRAETLTKALDHLISALEARPA